MIRFRHFTRPDYGQAGHPASCGLRQLGSAPALALARTLLAGYIRNAAALADRRRNWLYTDPG